LSVESQQLYAVFKSQVIVSQSIFIYW